MMTCLLVVTMGFVVFVFVHVLTFGGGQRVMGADRGCEWQLGRDDQGLSMTRRLQ